MSPHAFRYAAYYCEENVWHLAAEPQIRGEKRVMFISNRDRSCALWRQRTAPAPDAPVLWDYHVVLIAGQHIWDLDTTLDLPVSTARYLRETFPVHGRVDPKLEPRFRLIEASLFRESFASDRSHMFHGGLYQAPPPKWPMIGAEHGETNLFSFIDMEKKFLGEVYDLDELRANLNC